MSVADGGPVAPPGTALGRMRVSPATVGVLAMVLLLILVASLTTEAFPTASNVRAVLGAAALTGIAAIGLTFVTLSGNFVSLSIEQTAATVAVTLTLMLSGGWPVALALVVVILLAALVGAVQGATVGFGANPIIVTLGAGAALHGLGSILAGGKQVQTHSTSLEWLGDTRLLGIPMPTYAFIAVAIVATVYLRRRRTGQVIGLTGVNRATAAASGFSVLAVAVVTFAISSVAAAFVAILSVSQFNVATVDQFQGLTFDAIAAVLVGGTAIGGGEGSPARTALGAVFIAVLVNFMLLQGWPSGVRLGVQGVLVILAVSVYHLLAQRKRGT
jgi:ribose transport system permease protein